MDYREFAPSLHLARYIQCYWVLEDPQPEPGNVETIVPDGCAEWIFQLGTPYQQISSSGGLLHQPRTFVVGQLRAAMRVAPTGPISVFAIRFRPSGCSPWLRDAMHPLTDQCVEVGELSARPVLNELETRLPEAMDASSRVKIADTVLLQQRDRVGPIDGLAEAAVQVIRRSGGQMSLGDLTRQLSTSRRTLDRSFAQSVGLTPKLFSRQVRFQRILDHLRSNPKPRWSQVAQAVGCYDQAHLVREFRSFTGTSPTQFLRSEHRLSDLLTGLP